MQKEPFPITITLIKSLGFYSKLVLSSFSLDFGERLGALHQNSTFYDKLNILGYYIYIYIFNTKSLISILIDNTKSLVLKRKKILLDFGYNLVGKVSCLGEG